MCDFPSVPATRTMAVIAALVTTGLALAEVPPTDFFVGVYERVGRDDTGAPINDRVRLDPLGKGFQMSVCPASGALAPIIELEFSRVFESDNFLVGPPGQPTLHCQFHIDPQNYAILNCANTSGTLFTLWPIEAASGCSVPE